MSFPSKPVAIKSPRLAPIEPPEAGAPASLPASVGTPNLHALRAQYAGTPPPPNIPLRGITPTPNQRTGSPATTSLVPTTSDTPSSLRPGPQVVGG
ncbi:hypothetical protein D9615_010635 [Tricholomella constricta]|nr:hypothetical protein D9615_010635 [Tricholomella constricta]